MTEKFKINADADCPKLTAKEKIINYITTELYNCPDYVTTENLEVEINDEYVEIKHQVFRIVLDLTTFGENYFETEYALLQDAQLISEILENKEEIINLLND